MLDDVFGIVGSVIGGAYHVEKPVAEGGFGVVYRAHHGGFRAPVALKCLKVPQQLSAEDRAEFVEQCRQEAELLFRLSASIPSVVRPLHVDAIETADGSFVPYLVLEWLEGETLDSIVRRRTEQGLQPLGLRKLVRMLTPVARALERAHNFIAPDGAAMSIVHRDLKPENIFVAKVAGEEVVKILDFGIAKARSFATQVVGRESQSTGTPPFTPAYGAPEQWSPKRFGQTGAWTDVWGLALCMVEALVGRPVIDGDQTAMMGTVLDAARRPTPRKEGVVVSDAVEAVFAKALALDPRDRYRDAGLFWDELEAAIGASSSERGPSSARDQRVEQQSGRTQRIEVVGIPNSLRASSGVPSAPRAAERREPVGLPELDLDMPAVPALSSRAAPSRRDRTTRPEPQRNGAERQAPQSLAFEDDELVNGASGLDLDMPEPAVEKTPASVVAPTASIAEPTPAAVPPVVAPTSAEPTRAVPRETAAAPAWLRTAAPGGALIALSILITLIDQIYAASSGETLNLGPLRATAIAAFAMFLGIGLLVYMFFFRPSR